MAYERGASRNPLRGIPDGNRKIIAFYRKAKY